MKLSKLIERLKEIKETTGDLEVETSSDSEGNSFHSIDEVGYEIGKDTDNVITIWPGPAKDRW